MSRLSKIAVPLEFDIGQGYTGRGYPQVLMLRLGIWGDSTRNGLPKAKDKQWDRESFV